MKKPDPEAKWTEVLYRVFCRYGVRNPSDFVRVCRRPSPDPWLTIGLPAFVAEPGTPGLEEALNGMCGLLEKELGAKPVKQDILRLFQDCLKSLDESAEVGSG